MKIERHLADTAVIALFATQHDLTMQVFERRGNIGVLERFYAYFKGSEVKAGALLIGTHGNGNTEEEAIADYAKMISGRTIVIDARQTWRREIQVPTLV